MTLFDWVANTVRRDGARVHIPTDTAGHSVDVGLGDAIEPFDNPSASVGGNALRRKLHHPGSRVHATRDDERLGVGGCCSQPHLLQNRPSDWIPRSLLQLPILARHGGYALNQKPSVAIAEYR